MPSILRFADTDELILQRNNSIAALEAQISTLSDEIHQIEDKIFASFCKSVGVDNIREYEENQLKQAQERAARRIQLSALQSKLANQYVFMNHSVPILTF